MLSRNKEQKGRLRMLLRIFVMVFAVFMLSACEEYQKEQQDGEYGVKTEDGKGSVECSSCPLFKIAFSQVKEVYEDIQSKTAKPAITLLGIGFGLALAMHILKFVSSLKDPDVSGFWNELGIRTFWVIIGAASLNSIQDVSNYLVFPVFQGFIDFGVSIIAKLPSEGGAIACPTGDVGSSLECLVRAIEGKMGVGKTLGVSLIKFSNPTTAIFQGIVIYCVAFLMAFLFPLYLIDGVIRFGIAMSLLPMFVVSFCFPVTRDIAKKGWNIFMGVGFQNVMMCVFVALAVSCLKTYIAVAFPLMEKGEALSRDPKATMELANGSPGVFSFMFICFFLFLFGGVVLELVNNNFVAGAGGGGGTMGKALQTMAKGAASAAKFAGGRANKYVDKRAARNLSANRNKLANGVKLGKKDQAKMAIAEERLKSRGHIGADGKDKDSMGSLLSNGLGRDLLGKKDHAKDYVRQK